MAERAEREEGGRPAPAGGVRVSIDVLARYLAALQVPEGPSLRLLSVRPLSASGQAGQSVVDEPQRPGGAVDLRPGLRLLIELEEEGRPRSLVLRTSPADVFGHERPADRAGAILRRYEASRDGASEEPAAQVRPLGLGAATRAGELLSLDEASEYFLLMELAPGEPYMSDLERIAREGRLRPGDEGRVLLLADYLAELHANKRRDTALYRRRLRDVLGEDEGVLSLLDGLPEDSPLATAEQLERLEHLFVAWRWRLRDLSHRLSRVHGDFHPRNIIFNQDDEFRLLGRSRGCWGEPADDVAALLLHFLFFSLHLHASLEGPFRVLYELFHERYQEWAVDRELTAVLPPYVAWRALVLAHPLRFPELAEETRRSLLGLASNVLAADRFLPARLADYMP
jgi:hypothetical protein